MVGFIQGTFSVLSLTVVLRAWASSEGVLSRPTRNAQVLYCKGIEANESL